MASSRNTIIAKLSTTQSNVRSVRINVHPKYNETDSGYPITIYETLNSRNLPPQKAFLNLKAGGKDQWLSISTSARATNENGDYKLAPKRNEQGCLVNRKGDVVQTEEEAARSFIYEKENGRSFNIELGTLSIKNTNAEGQPTKCTLINAKLYSDKEAIAIRQMMKEAKNTPEEYRQAQYDKISDYKRNHGDWKTLFISEGHDFLRGLGFEVRENTPKNQPGNDYKDDIPF
ncbi:hypothetical protein [Vibrio parahaemolyticus]|uniref:hypothetical protein n=1 Tax=Vibrio parahaemolyticus TaxID=670 RepID=UPI0031CCAE24